jgi:hypothetical protein
MERTVSESLLQQTVGMLMHGGIGTINSSSHFIGNGISLDLKTSRTSTFPYNIEDTMLILELVKNVNCKQNWISFFKVHFIHHPIDVKEINGYSANIVGEDPTLYLLHLPVIDTKLTGRVMALIQ